MLHHGIGWASAMERTFCTVYAGMKALHMPAVTLALQTSLVVTVLLPTACSAIPIVREAGHTSVLHALHTRRLLQNTWVLPTSVLSHASQHLTEEQEQERRQNTVNWKDVNHLIATAHHHRAQTVHHPTLFIGVLSQSRHVKQRNAIRATWGADHRIRR